MRLNLIAISMSIISFISLEGFAQTLTSKGNNIKTVYPNKPIPIFCAINQSCRIMKEVTQNIGRAFPNPGNPGWMNCIALSGGINFDLGKWGSGNSNYMGENYQRTSINDAYLNLSAIVNDWVTAFASLSYNTATINNPNDSTALNHIAEFDAAYSDNIRNGSTSNFKLEQAFITIANFEKSPIFVQLGKQFQDFGHYEIHPITESLTQVMSKALKTSIKFGFLVKEFYGSVFSFEDPLPKVNHTSTSLNYGGTLGYSHQPTFCQMGLNAGISYLYNIIGIDDIAYNVNQFNLNNPVNLPGGGFNQHISGVALYTDVSYGPFNINARYMTAVQRFNPADLPKHGLTDIAPTGALVAGASGAQPWTVGIQVGYGFGIGGKPQNIYLGLQGSQQAAGLLLPRSRWLAGYAIEVCRNANLGVEWDHDRSYSVSNGGTGKNTNLVTLRAAVKFN